MKRRNFALATVCSTLTGTGFGLIGCGGGAELESPTPAPVSPAVGVKRFLGANPPTPSQCDHPYWQAPDESKTPLVVWRSPPEDWSDTYRAFFMSF